MTERARSGAILLGLALSALALALAPLLMPDSYSWIANTTSESAAQGVSGAWLARLGLGAFGLAVLALAWSHPSWEPVARFAHIGFGILMTVTAVASTKPWLAGVPYDAAEDRIHSFAATAMGFAFAFGIFAVVLGDRRSGRPIRAVDFIAILASVVIPLSMTALLEYAGILQRLMFIVAYVWYAIAALESAQVVSLRGSLHAEPRLREHATRSKRGGEGDAQKVQGPSDEIPVFRRTGPKFCDCSAPIAKLSAGKSPDSRSATWTLQN